MSSYQSVILADNPVAYWPMNEVSGNIADATGNGNTGVANGGLTYGVAGGVINGGTAITLDGTTAFFSVADAASIRVTGNGSWESWIDPANNTSNMAIFAKRSGNNAAPYDNLLVGGVGTGKLQFEVGNGTTTTLYRSNNGAFLGGVWQHLVITRAGSVVSFYVNGSLFQALTTAPVTVSDAGNALLLGSNVIGNTSNRFNGSFQHLAIYDYALTSPQVANHYNVGIAGAQGAGTPYLSWLRQ